MICFLDIRMPGLSGLEAARALAEDWPDGPHFPLLVFVTAYDQYALQAFDAQAVDYLLKPVDGARLAECVQRLQRTLATRQGAAQELQTSLERLRALLGAAAGIFAGGFVAAHTSRHDLVAVSGMAASAAFMFVLAAAWLPAAALPLLFASTGFFGGMTNPSRDLIVRATTPAGATGKVYGFVYSGLDVGSMLTPVFFGWLLDRGNAAAVFFSVVVASLLTIGTVLQLPRYQSR